MSGLIGFGIIGLMVLVVMVVVVVVDGGSSGGGGVESAIWVSGVGGEIFWVLLLGV